MNLGNRLCHAFTELPENLCVRLAEICAVQRVYDYTVAPEHCIVIIEEVNHSISGNIHCVQGQLRLEFRIGKLRISNRLKGAVFLFLVVLVPGVVVHFSQVCDGYLLAEFVEFRKAADRFCGEFQRDLKGLVVTNDPNLDVSRAMPNHCDRIEWVAVRLLNLAQDVVLHGSALGA
jgi:hypothetical protein